MEWYSPDHWLGRGGGAATEVAPEASGYLAGSDGDRARESAAAASDYAATGDVGRRASAESAALKIEYGPLRDFCLLTISWADDGWELLRDPANQKWPEEIARGNAAQAKALDRARRTASGELTADELKIPPEIAKESVKYSDGVARAQAEKSLFERFAASYAGEVVQSVGAFATGLTGIGEDELRAAAAPADEARINKALGQGKGAWEQVKAYVPWPLKLALGLGTAGVVAFAAWRLSR